MRVALIGIGAANFATYRMLKAAGVDPAAIVACDSRGILGPGRSDIEAARDDFAEKWQVCVETNAERRRGGIAEALAGMDACIAFSAGGAIRPDWVRRMAKDAIVFACANPLPEIWPWDARDAGARIVATGRSDFPNQVNNSLGFPGIFRGVLDVRARAISDGMAVAAADELAAHAVERGLRDDYILPSMDDPDVVPRIAVATAMRAQQEGLAALSADAWRLREAVVRRLEDTRRSIEAVLKTLPDPDQPHGW